MGIVLFCVSIVGQFSSFCNCSLPPAYVSYLENERNAVIRSYIHPNWKEGSLYGDVGLLQLKEPLKISLQFQPACIWDRADLPESEFFVSGRGLSELHAIHVEEDDLETSACKLL